MDGYWECNVCGALAKESDGDVPVLFDGAMCISFSHRSNVRFPPIVGTPERIMLFDGVHGDGTRSAVLCGSCLRRIGTKTDADDWSNPHHAGLFFIRTDAVRFVKCGLVINDAGVVIESPTR